MVGSACSVAMAVTSVVGVRHLRWSTALFAVRFSLVRSVFVLLGRGSLVGKVGYGWCRVRWLR